MGDAALGESLFNNMRTLQHGAVLEEAHGACVQDIGCVAGFSPLGLGINFQCFLCRDGELVQQLFAGEAAVDKPLEGQVRGHKAEGFLPCLQSLLGFFHSLIDVSHEVVEAGFIGPEGLQGLEVFQRFFQAVLGQQDAHMLLQEESCVAFVFFLKALQDGQQFSPMAAKFKEGHACFFGAGAEGEGFKGGIALLRGAVFEGQLVQEEGGGTQAFS